MARIEELPDDLSESLNSDKQQAGGTPVFPQASLKAAPFPVKDDGSKKGSPAMPPGMASVKSHTTDEILEMMNRTPLFMTDLAKATDGMFSQFAFPSVTLWLIYFCESSPLCRR
jgi:hypothetical protein